MISAKIKYDINIMKYISLFENITLTKVKDCIEKEGYLIFIVNQNDIAKAIGRNGANIKRLSQLLNRKIKIVEFNPNVSQFIRNYIKPLDVANIEEDNGNVTINGRDSKTKGMLIGRDNKNLDDLNSIVKRYFKIDNIKVK